MSSYEEALCNNTTDLLFILPDLQNYDRKIVLVNWTNEGSNLYSAGSTGSIDTLFRDDRQLGDAEANVAAVTEDGEGFYNSSTDLCTIYSLNSPTTHHGISGGRNFTNLKNEAIHRASEMCR